MQEIATSMRIGSAPRHDRLHNKRYQQGQALIYGIFVLIGGLAALFFLFNTGQLTREKTKLVNTADAVAYSAGVMHARTLNYLAYTNRAMVANTVAIAQLVSLASWVRYVDRTRIVSMYSNLGDPLKYPAFYPSFTVIQQEGSELNEMFIESGALEQYATLSDNIIRDVLVTAQQSAYERLNEANRTVMDHVAQANYLDGADGTVTVDVMPSSENAFTEFTASYDGDGRQRFAEVAERAAKQDGFQRRRSWMLFAMYSNCSPFPDWVERRGGTELLSFDEWKAVDTIAEHVWRRIPVINICLPFERPGGWGGQAAGDESRADLDLEHYDRSPFFNPITSAIASATSDSWDYSGIPGFYDLSQSFLDEEDHDPTLRFSIRLRRAIGQTATSEGRSRIGSTPRLNAYRAQPAGGNELIALSTAEVFFRRPDGSGNGCSSGADERRDNCFGRTEMGRGREIGSLFNPYWHVRLVHDQTAIKQARAMQGVVLP